MTDPTAAAGGAYIYVEMTINDAERFQHYTALSAPAVHAAGGWYPVRGVRPEVLEGAGVERLSSESVDRARAFYHSAAYQAAKLKRAGAADFKMLLLPGSPRQER